MKSIVSAAFLLLIVTSLNSCGLFEKGDQNLNITLRINDSKLNAVGCASAVSEVIQNRLNRYGLSNREYQIQVSGNAIELELRNLMDAERASKLIARSGKIEFWETYENEEVYPYLRDINEVLAQEWKQERVKSDEAIKDDKPANALLDKFNTDTMSMDGSGSFEEASRNNPLWAVLSPAGSSEGLYKGPVVGYAAKRDTAKINAWLTRGKLRLKLPRDLDLLWTRKPIDDSDTAQVFQLIAIKKLNVDNLPELDGSAISEAYSQFSSFNDMPEIVMRMNENGSRAWARMTRANVGRSIAIVLDNKVYSFPTVQSEIVGGYSNITGNFTEPEAADMANVLCSEPFPCKVIVVEKEISKTQ